MPKQEKLICLECAQGRPISTGGRSPGLAISRFQHDRSDPGDPSRSMEVGQGKWGACLLGKRLHIGRAFGSSHSARRGV
jgi:hypothetical protein